MLQSGFPIVAWIWPDTINDKWQWACWWVGWLGPQSSWTRGGQQSWGPWHGGWAVGQLQTQSPKKGWPLSAMPLPTDWVHGREGHRQAGGTQLAPTTPVFLSLEGCRHSGPWDLHLKQVSSLGEDGAGMHCHWATESTIAGLGVSRPEPESSSATGSLCDLRAIYFSCNFSVCEIEIKKTKTKTPNCPLRLPALPSVSTWDELFCEHFLGTVWMCGRSAGGHQ